MNENKRTLKEDIAMIIESYKVLFKIEKKCLVYPVITSIINSLFPFVNLFMSARILNELTGARDLRTLVIYAIITVSLNLLLHVIRRTIEMNQRIYTDSFWNKMNLFFNDVNNNMQYEHLENPATRILRDKIMHAGNATGGGLQRLMWSFGNFIYNFFTIVFSVSLSFGMFALRAEGDFSGLAGFVNSPYSVIIILVVILINTAVSMWCGKTHTEQSNAGWGNLANSNRLWSYYGTSIHNLTGAMDIRLFNQAPIIEKELQNSVTNPVYILLGEKLGIKFGSINTILNSVVSIIIYIYVGIKAFSGAFGIGMFLQYTGCVGKFVGGISGFISDIAGLRQNNIYMKDVLDYINMPNDMYQGTLPVEKRSDGEYEIEFKNVSFKYPGTDTYALKNLSMKLRIGQKLAVVGMNGSGKTTMIKLLCRLYDPTEGEILLNGVDIKKYKYDQYLNVFSVVFQDFNLFSFNLGQNIAASVEYDSESAEECLIKAGFGDRLKTLPKGLETALYKNFEDDGVEISGGEAQKIALARALYKNSPFIILDEPTSALDPIAEFEVYSKFNEIVGEKTAIYISHRLSSCRFCDDIAVFHEGGLVQRGSHGTLIDDEGGKYHELWNAQAQYYAEHNLEM